MPLACSAVLVSGCATPQAGPPPPAYEPPPPTAPVPTGDHGGVPERRGIELLYRDTWFGAVRLLGVDRAGQRAYVRLEGNAESRLAIDTVDVARGKRLARWEANATNAKASLRGYPKFRPLTGTFEEDLVQFANLLHSAGPWHMRGSGLTPTVAVSEDRQYILYGAPPDDGTDGDWLYVVDRNGERPRRIDSGLRASYSPVFSPDGTRVAWRGCQSSPCDYGLFVTRLGGKPDRVSKLKRVGDPTWSRNGKWLYALGNKGRDRCLFKVDVERTWNTKEVGCVRGLSDVQFVQDAQGRTGVLSGSRGEPGKQVVELRWLLLENGEVLSTQRVPGASGKGIVSDTGMLAVSVKKGGIALVDLITGKYAGIGGNDSWFFGLDTTKWLGDKLVLVRKPGGQSRDYHIVSIDARLLTEQAEKWRDGVDGI